MPKINRCDAATAVIAREWPAFKKLVDGTEKSLNLQYEETGRLYQIFCSDDAVLYLCEIFKTGIIPRGWDATKIADNDAYRTEFMSDWLGTANRASRLASQVQHFNGTAPAGSATVITFPLPSQNILIENMDNQDLLVSLDKGKGYKTLKRGDTLTAQVTLDCVHLIGTGPSGSDYEMMVSF